MTDTPPPDQETVFRLYRRAQKFLALPIDEGINPDDFGEDEMSEAERLVADLAVALSAAVPHGDEDDNPPPPADEIDRDELARVLEIVARDGLPEPRDLDAAIDAILAACFQGKIPA